MTEEPAPRASQAPLDAHSPAPTPEVGPAPSRPPQDDSAPRPCPIGFRHYACDCELPETAMPDTPRPACLFCDRTRHKILCESPGMYARFDSFPANPGHIEVVPKRHVVSYFDLTLDEVVEAHLLLREAAVLIDAEYDPDGWTIGINDGAAAGRSIDHLHVHLIPRHHGDVADPRGGVRQCAPNCDPDEWKDPTDA